MSKDSGLVMGVDGGGSQTTAWLANLAGRILGKGRATASNYQSVGETDAQNALLSAIQDAFKLARIPMQQLDSLCLGLAGYGRDFDRQLIKAWAEKTGLSEQVVVVNDADLLLWAATPHGWGLGLVCGTGSIAVGRTQDGKTARAGGWGYLIGDEGSGYAIGIAALRAVVQAADQRIPDTRLTAGVLKKFNVAKAEELVPLIYQVRLTRETIAQLSSVVFETAQGGDWQAVSILDRAVTELTKAALSVGSQLNWQTPVPCALGGGIFQHYPSFVHQVLEGIRQGGMQLDPIQVVDEPVAGAVKLAIHSMKSNIEENQP